MGGATRSKGRYSLEYCTESCTQACYFDKLGLAPFEFHCIIWYQDAQVVVMAATHSANAQYCTRQLKGSCLTLLCNVDLLLHVDAWLVHSNRQGGLWAGR
jgi:hypothetical protein